MMQSKLVTVTITILWMVLSLYYYNIFSLISAPQLEAPRLNNQLVMSKDDSYLINTPGCSIPNYSKTLKSIEAKNTKKTCGLRAVYVKKITAYNITFIIDKQKMKHYKAYDFDCCFQFAKRSKVKGQQDSKIEYSNCNNFKNGTSVYLTSEVIKVRCLKRKSGKVKHVLFYTDHFTVLKRVKNLNKTTSKSNKWNVLIFGMDTVSRHRFLKTMPQTAKYLQTNKWLDYTGYNKVASNTFPNLMSLLTGKTLATIGKNCYSDSVKKRTMSDCNHLMVWNQFQKHEYITAVGEDFINLPDTFKNYNGFSTPPTHHYMRPFFLLGEESIGNLVCAGKVPSTVHILNYAKQFATAYKETGFFGFFWSNSYSHNTNNLPTLLDADLEKFFKYIEESGVINNTFVILLSDHGKRFGEERVHFETYYEERIPMLFVKAPTEFQKQHREYYKNMETNQNRLVTPYDLHLTLASILKLSNDNYQVAPSEACPNCLSLFHEISPQRTCADVSISLKWCTCYNLIPTPTNSTDVLKSALVVVEDIRKRIKIIKTTNCHTCLDVKLDSVVRSHMYKNGGSTFYNIAFSVTPGNNFYEATVSKNSTTYKHLGPVSLLIAYQKKAFCALNAADKIFCVCKKMKNCT